MTLGLPFDKTDLSSNIGRGLKPLRISASLVQVHQSFPKKWGQGFLHWTLVSSAATWESHFPSKDNTAASRPGYLGCIPHHFGGFPLVPIVYLPISSQHFAACPHPPDATTRPGRTSWYFVLEQTEPNCF